MGATASVVVATGPLSQVGRQPSITLHEREEVSGGTIRLERWPHWWSFVLHSFPLCSQGTMVTGQIKRVSERCSRQSAALAALSALEQLYMLTF